MTSVLGTLTTGLNKKCVILKKQKNKEIVKTKIQKYKHMVSLRVLLSSGALGVRNSGGLNNHQPIANDVWLSTN